MASNLKRSSFARFEALNSDICAEDAVKVTVLSIAKQDSSTKDISERSIDSGGLLQRYLSNEYVHEKRDTIIILRQDYTWSRLPITKSSLQDLAQCLEIFAGFWDVVNTYGVKTHQDERAFYGWRSSVDITEGSGMKHEYCYNVPYMEKHKRDLPDPWSLRQTGVYQQFSSSEQSSRWIMLNLRDNVRQDLRHVLKTKEDCCYLSTHAELLSLLESNWTEYVEYLSLQLRDLDDKACYTTIDRAEKDGFTVSYEDLQDIHKLQAKIQRAIVTLSSCIEIGTGCQSSFEYQPEKLKGVNLSCQKCRTLLAMYNRAMSERLQNTKRLDIRLGDVLNLLSRILICRNEVLLTSSNQASGSSLRALLDITEKSEEQQSSLAQILSVVQAESVLLKALSIVATVCLPASLIGTVFSSNLIQTIPDLSTAEPTRMVLAPQFWIYIVLSIPTMFATLALVLYLDQRAYKRIEALAAESGHPLPPRPSSWRSMSKTSSRSTKSKPTV